MSNGADMSRDPDLEAAEYVLGTLDASERRAFERRLPDDSSARLAVAAWEHRFAGLTGRLEPVDPPAAVWDRVQQRLSGNAAPRRPGLTVLDGGASRAGARSDLAASRGRWRAAALSLGTVAAALAVMVAAGLRQPNPAIAPAGERWVAAVNRGGDKPALIVAVDLATRRVLVMPVAAEAPAGHSLELWYIGEDKPPRAMGLVDKSPATMAIPAGADGAGATFAVSVEPPGGSKTGGPTGPVVYSGQLVKE